MKHEAEWRVAEVQNGIKSTDPKGCIDIIVIACEMLLCYLLKWSTSKLNVMSKDPKLIFVTIC